MACHAVHAWHTVTHYYHAAVHVVVQTADVAGLAAALRDARGALARGVAVAGHLARDVGTGIADAARAGAHVLGSAWHAAVSAGAAVAHGVTRYASQQYHAVVHAVKTAYHAVARVATATVDFVKHHAAVIASVVVSAAVFIGCDAALGVATGGVGAVAGATACGALAGAAGNASVARDAGSFAPEDASQIASVDTPSGPAAQDASAGAMAARGQVEAGAPLYRVGSMGRSQAAEAQFWSLEHPATPGFAARYGIPPENVANYDFVEQGRLVPGTPFVTRAAPAVGTNPGGGIEVVVPPGGADLNWFSALGPKGLES